jgi:ribosomal protein L35AE/L33A
MVANAAQHVERYHQQTGAWPTTLEQAGAHGGGIRYERAGTGYRLQGENGEVRVRFDSAEPLARFIGNSFEVISRRSR